MAPEVPGGEAEQSLCFRLTVDDGRSGPVSCEVEVRVVPAACDLLDPRGCRSPADGPPCDFHPWDGLVCPEGFTCVEPGVCGAQEPPPPGPDPDPEPERPEDGTPGDADGREPPHATDKVGCACRQPSPGGGSGAAGPAWLLAVTGLAWGLSRRRLRAGRRAAGRRA